MRRWFRLTLERKGWMVRRMRGMSAGVDLVWDIKQRLRYPLRLIVDVGAHKGETIEYFHERVSNCEILAFEPVASTFAVLHSRWGGTS
jgi:hypothetical protein